MAGTSSRSPIVLSDDDEPADPAAQTPPVEGSGDDEQVPRPEWLPDGFDVGVYRTGNGTPYRYYVCAVGGFEFNYEFEVLEYVSSGALGRAVEANATLEDKTTLQGKYEWLRDKPPWVMEIRAGGKNMSKLFKFYAHLDRGVRVASKDDVIRYINESKIAECPYDECDTSCEDNIIAQLQFRIAGLPPGWVKETAFRKCSDGIRKDSVK
ncbi:uncharacterized protein LOC133925657 [Phragmites australis]|uniref:uncharacterized protein LOC133925657 n=1 Tax=Phragmites australis TaxID=29695 RepID=UPI002D77C636|nr:uncharacterized protein LOC133925657 [Phragmites australis]